MTKQLNVIKHFLHEASEIVHAGDPDREGQLLVDEVLDYLQLAPEKRQQVQRCLINDLNPQAVERAIDRLRSIASLYRCAFLHWRGRGLTGCTALI